MPIIDFIIIIAYLLGVFLVGLYFYKKNKTRDDYYVGGRNLSPWHVGLSVVATDVGGGFSIALGGLGFTMGLSGSWMLFTGLIGAWLSAVIVIPRLKLVDSEHKLLTYPDFLEKKYNRKVALFAAIISSIGYMGFTGGQIKAGAVLAQGTIFKGIPLPIDPEVFALIIIAGIILLYTVLGGLKAVIYTDTVQWIILLTGLIAFAIPFTWNEIGGMQGLRENLPPEFLSLNNITTSQLINWFVTILPIWFIAMTLYQRKYACKDTKDAKKAWFIAGLFEYPIMAFAGVFLGMCARIFFPESDPELGLPRLLKEVLPIGLQGLVIAAYFSAVMSTADSCLIASSGNFVNDFYEKYINKNASQKHLMKVSQITTAIVGTTALVIAWRFETVLDLILDAYTFMVGSLLIATLAAYIRKKPASSSAFASMIAGGLVTTLMMWKDIRQDVFGQGAWIAKLDASFWGILASLIVFLIWDYSGLSKKSKLK